jgi:hypothetical protein
MPPRKTATKALKTVAPTKKAAPARRTRGGTTKAGKLHTPATKSYDGVYDTKEQIIYTNIALDARAARSRGYSDVAIENTIIGNEDFIAFLNKAEGEERFIPCRVVSAYEIRPDAGINKLYAAFLDINKDLRISAAIDDMRGRFGFSFHRDREGVWVFSNYDSGVYIRELSRLAKITAVEARNALYDFLHGEMGNFIEKMKFPTVEQAEKIDREPTIDRG